MNQLPEQNVSITKMNGGFIVCTESGSQIVTTLSKAIKILRETLEDKTGTTSNDE